MTRSSPTRSPGRGSWRSAAGPDPPAEAERIVRSGVAALQGGGRRAAAAAFEKVAASGRAGAPVWLVLAHAHRSTGDSTAEEAALDAWLEIEDERGQIAALFEAIGVYSGAGG